MEKQLGLIALLCVCCAGPSANAPWMMDQLRKQASFDMNCPEKQLSTVETGQFRYGVRGCDRQATYLMQMCNTSTEKCTYSLNTPVSDVPGVAKAPEPAPAQSEQQPTPP